MFCNKCGKQLREDDIFCSNCGAKVDFGNSSGSRMAPGEIDLVNSPGLTEDAQESVLIIDSFFTPSSERVKRQEVLEEEFRQSRSVLRNVYEEKKIVDPEISEPEVAVEVEPVVEPIVEPIIEPVAEPIVEAEEIEEPEVAVEVQPLSKDREDSDFTASKKAAIDDEVQSTLDMLDSMFADLLSSGAIDESALTEEVSIDAPTKVDIDFGEEESEEIATDDTSEEISIDIDIDNYDFEDDVWEDEEEEDDSWKTPAAAAATSSSLKALTSILKKKPSEVETTSEIEPEVVEIIEDTPEAMEDAPVGRTIENETEDEEEIVETETEAEVAEVKAEEEAEPKAEEKAIEPKVEEVAADTKAEEETPEKAMAEEEEETSEKGSIFKSILMGVLTLILAVMAICAVIFAFAGNTAIGQKLHNAWDNIVGGQASAVVEEEDAAAIDVSETEGQDEESPEEAEEEEVENLELVDEKPDETTDFELVEETSIETAIESVKDRGPSIGAVEKAEGLVFDGSVDYGVEDADLASVFFDELWYSNDQGENVHYIPEIVGTTIEYYSKLMDRMNKDDEEVLKLIEPDSKLMTDVTAIKADAVVIHTLKTLKIGEIRKYGDNFYVLVELTDETNDGKPETVAKKILRLSVNDKSLIVSEVADVA